MTSATTSSTSQWDRESPRGHHSRRPALVFTKTLVQRRFAMTAIAGRDGQHRMNSRSRHSDPRHHYLFMPPSAICRKAFMTAVHLVNGENGIDTSRRSCDGSAWIAEMQE